MKGSLKFQGGEMTHKMHIFLLQKKKKALISPYNDWIEKENAIFGILGIHHNQAWLELNVSN